MSTETAAMMGKAPCSRILQVGEMSIWRQNHTESRVKDTCCFLQDVCFPPCLGITSWNCIVTYWVLSWLVSSCWICRGTTRMLCFSTRLRPTRSESIVTRHFLGILRLESEFKGNIGGIPSHSITWLQDVAKGCSLGMQPTFFGSLWWSQVVHPKGTYVITLCMPRVSSVWEWTHWRVGEVSLRTQPDFYLEFSWPVHVQVLWFARSPNSMRSGTSFSGHYWECIEDQCVSICKTLDSFSTLYCHQLWDWLNRNAGSIFERVWESLEDIYVSLPEWLYVLVISQGSQTSFAS